MKLIIISCFLSFVVGALFLEALYLSGVKPGSVGDYCYLIGFGCYFFCYYFVSKYERYRQCKKMMEL